MWNKHLDKTGSRQTYTQKVAAAMNWWRRNMLGLRAAAHFQSGYFIRSAPEFAQMSDARKHKLASLELRKQAAIEAVDALLREIEEFQQLPITIDDELKQRSPRKRKRTQNDTPIRAMPRPNHDRGRSPR